MGPFAGGGAASALDDLDGVRGVVSLLGLLEGPSARHPALSGGLALTVELAQALHDQRFDGGRLWCVTRGAVSTGLSDGPVSPVQAQVWGVGYTAALEHPQWWGGLVDLPEAFDARAAQRLVSVLAGLSDEDQVAIRPSGVFARRLGRATPPGRADRRSWSPEATTLVTGGTGRLGPHLARWLANRGGRKLVLTSRRGMAAPGAAALVEELAGLGCEAVVVACDVSDRGAVA